MTREELCKRLHALSKEMTEVGMEMRFEPHMADLRQQGGQMLGASIIADEWAYHIEAAAKENEHV